MRISNSSPNVGIVIISKSPLPLFTSVGCGLVEKGKNCRWINRKSRVQDFDLWNTNLYLFCVVQNVSAWFLAGILVLCCYTYLLTYSMVQSPSWEANWFADSQEIPRISRNPKVHYHTHKRPRPVSILGQPNPVHIPISHLLEIHPNIIHPSTPRSPQWSPSLRFPQQDPIHPPLLTHTRHMPSPSHSSRFYQPHNIGWGVQII